MWFHVVTATIYNVPLQNRLGPLFVSSAVQEESVFALVFTARTSVPLAPAAGGESVRAPVGMEESQLVVSLPCDDASDSLCSMEGATFEAESRDMLLAAISLPEVQMPGGLADVNLDGLPDVFVTRSDLADLLYVSDASGGAL